jgi:hypothetical protein
MSSPTFELFDTLKAEVLADPQVKALHDRLTTGTAPEEWALVDGLLLYKGKIFVPDASTLWTPLLQQAYEAGHEGMEKTLHRWRASYKPQALKRVREFVKGCTVCQRNKSEHMHPASLLQPLPVPHNV